MINFIISILCDNANDRNDYVVVHDDDDNVDLVEVYQSIWKKWLIEEKQTNQVTLEVALTSASLQCQSFFLSRLCVANLYASYLYCCVNCHQPKTVTIIIIIIIIIT